ncbi:MAG TPA: hypothetical protein VIL74_08945 [Pyrinomonadaceae bacterium]|jgi:hypothetical protein
MINELNDDDWKEAFGFAGEPDTAAGGQTDIRGALPTESYNLAPFTREDVKAIVKADPGENDEANWIIYGELHDGRWFSIEAGCDYSGWFCQSGGTATIGRSKEEIERFGLTADARERFKIVLDE